LLGIAIQGVQAQSGAYLSKDCAACHDSEQGHNQAIPTLVGQKRAFLRNRLEEFRHPGSDAKVMPRLTSGYSPAEIEQIADYLSSRPSPLRPAPDRPAQGMAEGFAQYRAHCAACHEQVDESPLLLGQNRTYLVNALRDFIYGVRAMPDGMRENLSALDTDKLAAVLEFMAASNKGKE
jgi:cytochrome c553